MKATCVERKRLKVAVVGIAMPLIKAREPNRDRGAIMWFGQRRFGLAFLGRKSMLGPGKVSKVSTRQVHFHSLLHF